VLTLALDPTYSVDAVLTPERRILKASDSSELEPLQSWAKLFQPVSTTLTEELLRDDPELHTFLSTQRTRFDFHVVVLACDFEPPAGRRFERAWLQVQLDREDGEATPAPIAWSIKPLRGEDSMGTSRTVELGGSLKLVSAKVSQVATRQRKLPYVLGHNELGSSPHWEFRPTPDSKLEGSHRCAVVVRAPAGIATRGSVELSAVVIRARLKILHRAQPVGAPFLTFAVPE
jgi:hypothetical protein